MFVYIILILLWFFATQLIISKKLQSIICGFLLFLVMGLRHPSIGSDTEHYLYVFLELTLNQLGNSANPEFGFVIFNYLLLSLGVGPQLYLLITSAIISFVISYFFYTYSKSIFFSFYLFLTVGLFTMSLTGISQMLSISFCLLAYIAFTKLIKFRYLVSIFLLTLAFYVHNSAKIFVVMYFIQFIELKKYYAVFLITVVFSTFFYRDSLTNIVEYLSPIRYENFEYLSDKHKINPLVILVSFLIPLASLLVLKNGKIRQPKISEFYIFSSVNVLMNILSLSSNLLGRLGFYFNPFNMILIPNTIFSIEEKKLRYILIILF